MRFAKQLPSTSPDGWRSPAGATDDATGRKERPKPRPAPLETSFLAGGRVCAVSGNLLARRAGADGAPPRWLKLRALQGIPTVPWVSREVCGAEGVGATSKPRNDRTHSAHLSRSHCLCGFWRSRSRVPCDDRRVSAGNRARQAAGHTPCSSRRHPRRGWCQRGTAEAGRDTGMDTCRPAGRPGGRRSHGENESPARQPGRGMKNTIPLRAEAPQREEGGPLCPPAQSPAAEDVRTVMRQNFFSSLTHLELKGKTDAGPTQTGQAVAWSPARSSAPRFPGSNKTVIINSKQLPALA